MEDPVADAPRDFIITGLAVQINLACLHRSVWIIVFYSTGFVSRMCVLTFIYTYTVIFLFAWTNFRELPFGAIRGKNRTRAHSERVKYLLSVWVRGADAGLV